MDFQGNVLDIADIKPNSAVQTLDRATGDVAQRWLIEPSGSLFTITNPTLSTFLSYSTASFRGDPICSQLFGQPSVPTLWNVVHSANKLGFNAIRAIELGCMLLSDAIPGNLEL
ncbi:hypothetical protein B0H13DRAFT_2325156 [Mycena leptocephala]|nr:hypothetical protein B0H13DRAFT_2325156 [Mycena leptocephala]